MAKENMNYVPGRRGEYKYCDNAISGVYIIINDITKEFYIGSSINVNIRISHHFGQLKRNVHNCERLQENYNKYSYDDYSFYILYRSEDKEHIRHKEQELLDDNYDNPLLLNTTTKNNNWVDERNGKKVKLYKEKLSDYAKTRTGSKNPFYGKKHSEETRQKIRERHLGKENESCHKPIVINGVFYKSVTEASKLLELSQPTVSHRVNSNNKLFVNWYVYNDTEEIKIIDDRLLFEVSSTPTGLYKVKGKLYTNTKDILDEYNLKMTTLHYRFKSKTFEDWEKLV